MPAPMEVKEVNGTTEFKLAAPRKAVKTGMPTEGMWLLVGLPKAGKTTLAASIPGAVILELEKNGADRVSGWVQEVPDMVTFRAALKACLNDKSVKVVVIDTLDVLLDHIEDDVAAKHGLENMSERKEGVNGFAVWGELRQKVNNLVATLKGCGKLVVLLAHLKDPKTDSEGKVVMSNAINAPGKIGSYICSQADAIGNCFKRQSGSSTQYVLSFQGGSGVIGMFGSRLSELEDKTVILPKENQWAAVEALFAQKKTK